MKKLKIFIFQIIFLLIASSAFAWSGKVVGITDGDTIKVLNPENNQVKIRLYGIDTPEKGQAYGQAATKHLASLIAGKTVEVEPVDTDRYGRTVAIISYDGRNINEQMVTVGYAWVYRKYCDRPFCSSWLKRESEAKDSKKGLWKEPNPIAPWEWREEELICLHIRWTP
ncbi:thermonuclease family protein [Thermodesulfobacteriota bacterium]